MFSAYNPRGRDGGRPRAINVTDECLRGIEHFEGSQKIDAHNHHRQGREGVVLEIRDTQR